MAVEEVVKKPVFLIKFLELVISSVIAGLTSDKMVVLSPDFLLRYAVVNGTIVSFIILGALIVIGYILECPLDKKLIIISAVTGCVLFATSGGLIIDAYSGIIKNTQILAAGGLAVVNAFVYAGDVFVTWKFS